MATIKTYTDISQSKKLAEILPLESADMCYVIDYAELNKYGTDYFKLEVDTYGLKVQTRDNIPCWSLAALISVLPVVNFNTPMLKIKLNHKYYMGLSIDSLINKYIITNDYDNPVDACVELILKLHELKML